MSQGDKKQLGRIALQQRVVKPSEAQASQADRDNDPDRLKRLSEQFGIPAINLRQICVRLADLELLPREIARRHVILPVLVRDDRLFVAMANPADKKVIDELEFVTDKKVHAYVAIPERLEEAIDEAYRLRSKGEAYYVGPDCPPDVLRKVGLLSDPAEQPSGAGASSDDSAPVDEPVVLLDDTARDAVDHAEIEDEGFGDVSKELSVVTDILVEERAAQAPGAKTILVVDDEPEIRTMIEKLLKTKGYHVITADNGRTALKIVKDREPDLIVLDAMLPEIHGFDLARRIKGSERYKHIPIVMVSAVYRGWRYAEDLRESCGVEHYIEKPFKIAEVLGSVEAALAAGRGPSSDHAKEMSDEAERELNAGVVAYQEGRMEDAVDHLKRGIQIDPLAYRLHFHLGLLYGKRGLVYEAIGELERAVEINARHFLAAKNLAILYQKAGFRNKATEMWERALNVAPDEATKQSIKQHLVSLL